MFKMCPSTNKTEACPTNSSSVFLSRLSCLILNKCLILLLNWIKFVPHCQNVLFTVTVNQKLHASGASGYVCEKCTFQFDSMLLLYLCFCMCTTAVPHCHASLSKPPGETI